MTVRTRFGILLLLTAVFAPAPAADACTVGSVEFDRAFLSADVVMTARVTMIEDAPATSYTVSNDVWPASKRAKLAVSEVWKGNAAGVEFLAYTESTSACGFELLLDQTFILFAQRSRSGALITSRHGVSGIGVYEVDGAFLERYRAQTATLRHKAVAGATADEFSLALHLTRWNDPLRSTCTAAWSKAMIAIQTLTWVWESRSLAMATTMRHWKHFGGLPH